MTLLFIIIGALALAGGYAAYYIKRQGDSDIVLVTQSIEAPELIKPEEMATFSRSLTFENRGTQDGVLLDVRVSAPRAPGVLIEPSIVRKGTRPSQLGYWVSNILEPGESCEGELTVEMSTASSEALGRLNDLSLTVSFDAVGRSLLVTKSPTVKIVVPARDRRLETRN
ncbi:MAG: hypothetical protein M1548_09630 [Actinobacteria bacterium]|nr:hypothetical protein [Actinomycetota bacterium]